MSNDDNINVDEIVNRITTEERARHRRPDGSVDVKRAAAAAVKRLRAEVPEEARTFWSVKKTILQGMVIDDLIADVLKGDEMAKWELVDRSGSKGELEQLETIGQVLDPWAAAERAKGRDESELIVSNCLAELGLSRIARIYAGKLN